MLMVDIGVLDLSFYAIGRAWHNSATEKEDMAMLVREPDQPDQPDQSDSHDPPSAFLIPYGMGRYLTVPPIFTPAAAYAGGFHAINLCINPVDTADCPIYHNRLLLFGLFGQMVILTITRI